MAEKDYISREAVNDLIKAECSPKVAAYLIDAVATIPAADAIEELQATLCNWCAVCPEDKRDLSTCEIYESCRAKPPKEE